MRSGEDSNIIFFSWANFFLKLRRKIWKVIWVFLKHTPSFTICNVFLPCQLHNYNLLFKMILLFFLIQLFNKFSGFGRSFFWLVRPIGSNVQVLAGWICGMELCNLCLVMFVMTAWAPVKTRHISDWFLFSHLFLWFQGTWLMISHLWFCAFVFLYTSFEVISLLCCRANYIRRVDCIGQQI